MGDESWRKAEGTWGRLAWARERRYPGLTKKAVAEKLGVQPGTYNAYERRPGSSKWIRLDHELAVDFAKKLRVRWQWLLLGEGVPWLAEDDGPKARAKRAIEAATDEQAEAAAEILEKLFGRTGTGG